MLLLFWKTGARFRPGLLVGVFTAGIAAARFARRIHPRARCAVGRVRRTTPGLSMGQWLTIPMILIGGLAVAARR